MIKKISLTLVVLLVFNMVLFSSVCYFKKVITDVGYYVSCSQVGFSPNRYRSISFCFYITETCNLFTISTSMDCNVTAQYSNYRIIRYYDETCLTEIENEREVTRVSDVTMAEESNCE